MTTLDSASGAHLRTGRAGGGLLDEGGLALSAAARRVESSVIRDLLRLAARPDVISLAGGLPDPASFPVEALDAATSTVLARDRAAAVQYSPTEGDGPLRAWVADDHDVPVDQVMVVAGSQQGLDLVARALVDPGDAVVTADPAYVGAIQAFRLAGAQLVGVPSDGDGLVVEVLAERLAAGLRPRLVYVVPNLSNPTGATLSRARARALAELADRYGFFLVEDDPYEALRWSGPPATPLASLSERVVTLRTTSKVLCPGLRVGFLVAPAALVVALVRLKQGTDLHTSTLTQRVVHELLSRPGFVEERRATLPTRYQARAQAMTAAVRRHLGPAADVAEPDGGMFVWARLRDSAGEPVGAARLLPRAVAAGVAYVPGNAFAVTHLHDHADHLRLSFATATPTQIDEGIHRLARLVA